MDPHLISVPRPPEPPSLVQLYFGFAGRVSRRDFWLHGGLVLFGIGLLAFALFDIARIAPETAGFWVNLLLLWPSLALSVKRWHDRDKSGWWMLIVLLPLIGMLWFLIANGFFRGTAGPNRFGPDPLAPAADR